MNINIFDRTKYMNSIKMLKAREAPDYIIEAYKNGYIKEINYYYKARLSKKPISESATRATLRQFVTDSNLSFLKEAMSQQNYDFIKAFFQMTNMDIMTGEKLPPDAGNLIKQGIVKDFGLKDLFKKLK